MHQAKVAHLSLLEMVTYSYSYNLTPWHCV